MCRYAHAGGCKVRVCNGQVSKEGEGLFLCPCHAGKIPLVYDPLRVEAKPIQTSRALASGNWRGLHALSACPCAYAYNASLLEPRMYCPC